MIAAFREHAGRGGHGGRIAVRRDARPSITEAAGAIPRRLKRAAGGDLGFPTRRAR
jgi:hypothetical protein